MPRRNLKRLVRISLRMVLVLTMILCVWIGMNFRQAERQKTAVAWVTGEGGKVEYEFEAPEWLYMVIGVEDLSKVDDYFSTVRYVGSFPPDHADVAPLANLPNIRHLDLRSTQVSDLAPLAKLEELERLALADTPVTDLSPLSNLVKLEVLWLNYSQVADLSPLENLTRLEYLSLNDTAVTDVSVLTRLTHLKRLSLPVAHVSEEDVAKLQEVLPNCKISIY